MPKILLCLFRNELCGKCDKGFVKFRESMHKVLCIMKDDRMNVTNCSMYLWDNDKFKCIDCAKGYKLNLGKEQCEKSAIRNDDIDDII